MRGVVAQQLPEGRIRKGLRDLRDPETRRGHEQHRQPAERIERDQAFGQGRGAGGGAHGGENRRQGARWQVGTWARGDAQRPRGPEIAPLKGRHWIGCWGFGRADSPSPPLSRMRYGPQQTNGRLGEPSLPKAACFSCHPPPGAATRHPKRIR